MNIGEGASYEPEDVEEALKDSINQSINQSLFKHGKIHQEFKN